MEPRRAATAVQRAPRRHEPGRSAARAAELRRGLSAPRARLHAAPQGEGRHHRLGADQRLARQHVDREAHRVRPVLHRAVVDRLRLEDPDADPVALSQPQRVLRPRALVGPRALAAARVPLLLLLVAGLAVSISLAQITLGVLVAWALLARWTGVVPRLRWPLLPPIVAFAAWRVVAALA